jgi:hypothetical protein
MIISAKKRRTHETMNAECLRIADQLARAFAGDAWHGPPLRDILAGISASRANARPLACCHSIWELTVHIDLYLKVAIDATEGIPMPRMYESGIDWPRAEDTSETAWSQTCGELFGDAERLEEAIRSWTDVKLLDTAPGRDYDFYYLFHGLVQHSLYHGGQIAMLKKAAAEGERPGE